ncbi:hypothetical protein DFJ74DRAFT_460065 [Hyaloraphidium curvatum]|nr:hypothetical protein DFJ74DRAFT_460065 [Hyaloraphidium curvatum]
MAASAPAWVTDYYKVVDQKSIPALLPHHTEDSVIKFANNPPAVGHDAIAASIGPFFSSIAGMKHRFVNVWEQGRGAQPSSKPWSHTPGSTQRRSWCRACPSWTATSNTEK